MVMLREERGRPFSLSESGRRRSSKELSIRFGAGLAAVSALLLTVAISLKLGKFLDPTRRWTKIDEEDNICQGNWRVPSVKKVGPGPARFGHAHIALDDSDYVHSTPWFTPQRICEESCCAEQYLLRVKKEETTLMTEISMKEIAEVRFGSTPDGRGRYNSEVGTYQTAVLTDKIAPCLQPGTSIKVERNETVLFFRAMEPLLPHPYVLISGGGYGGDWPTPLWEHDNINSRKLLHWFTLHPNLVLHGKISPIPLGANIFSTARSDIQRYLAARQYQNPFRLETRKCFRLSEDDDEIDTLASFRVATNLDERKPAWKVLCGKKPNDDEKPYNRSEEEASFVKCSYYNKLGTITFFEDVDRVTFALSPRGTGYDCHRNWELLAMGVIPIVTRFPAFDELFDDLPFMTLDSWNLTRTEFRQKQRAFLDSDLWKTSSFEGWRKLFNAYWRSRVLEAGGRSAASRTDPVTGERFHLLWRYWET